MMKIEFSKKLDQEEYFQLIQNQNGEYSYDGIEEVLPDSDDERMDDDDERLYTNDDRSSFTREQFVEYQQLIKLLRFVKVRFSSLRFTFLQ